MSPDFWSFFHDGSITRAEGTVPGDVRLCVDIQYLREMFPGEGESFIVQLKDCSSISYLPYDGPAVDSLQEIEAAEPEILYVQSTEPLILDCAQGTLSVSYETASLTLDTGEEVGYEDLVQASGKYWDAFGEKG